MLRSRGFKRPTLERIRSPLIPMRGRGGVIAQVGDVVAAVPKGEKAKPGKRAPTIEEADWMRRISALGCIACILDGQAPRPTAVHHILRGGQRMGHLFTIPLCQPGHHMDGGNIGIVSRHPFKARFEKRYGSELDLLRRVQVLTEGWE